MRSILGLVAGVAVLLCVGCGEQSLGSAAQDGHHPEGHASQTTFGTTGSTVSSPTPSEKAKRRRPAQAPYEWLNDYTPSDSYAIALVRGLPASEVLRALGTVRRDAGPLTADQAMELHFDLMDPRTYSGPPVVQVDVLGDGIFIYSPYGFRPFERLTKLSHGGVAASFVTTVELDTWIKVAENGKLIRDFDPYFYDRRDRKGALPEEQGLGLGGDDPFGPSWAFLDRVTSLHVEQDWFNAQHPTYVLHGRE